MIYFSADQGPEGQRTIVSETHGPLTGRRVVRGRETGMSALLSDEHKAGKGSELLSPFATFGSVRQRQPHRRSAATCPRGDHRPQRRSGGDSACPKPDERYRVSQLVTSSTFHLPPGRAQSERRPIEDHHAPWARTGFDGSQ